MLEMTARPNVGVVAQDLEAMVRFYRDGIGLPEISTSDAPPTPDGRRRRVHILGLDGAQLKIWGVTPRPPAVEPAGKMGRSGFSYLTLTVAGLGELIDRLRDSGYAIAEPPHRAASGAPLTMGWVQDPDGNWIELVEHDRVDGGR